MSRSKKQSEKLPFAGMVVMTLFFLSGFILLYMKSGDGIALVFAFTLPLIFWLGLILMPRLMHADPPLLLLVYFLCGVGILLLFDMKREWAEKQLLFFLAGHLAMILCSQAVTYIRRWGVLCLLMLIASLGLLAAPVFFGKTINGARAWLSFGGISFQPSEPVKIIFLLVMAYLLSQRQVIPAIFYAGSCLVLLMLEMDLGTALLYFFSALLLLWAATGSLLLILGGIGCGAGAAVLGYFLFSHVKVRVSVWLDPFTDPQGKGYQVIHGLFAIVNGGLWGRGLGQGNAAYIPEAQNDYIFAVAINEFGILFGAILVLMYLLIVIRGFMIARRSADMMHAMLSMGSAGLLALQSLVIIGGILKVIPLTGVTLPFISMGGSSLISAMGIIGLMQGVAGRSAQVLAADENMAMVGSLEEEIQ